MEEGVKGNLFIRRTDFSQVIKRLSLEETIGQLL